MTERSHLYLTLLFASLTALALTTGCSCGSGDQPAATCLTDSDCSAGNTCTDGACRPSSPAPDGDILPDAPPAGPRCESAIFCGMPPECCESGTECIEGACVPVCVRAVSAARALAVETHRSASPTPVSLLGAHAGTASIVRWVSSVRPTLNRCLPQFDPVECIVPRLGAFETTQSYHSPHRRRRPDCLHTIAPRPSSTSMPMESRRL